MSREIKFRYTVVRKNGHIFHRDFTIAEADFGDVANWLDVNHIDVDTLNRRQFTGLLDKNGKEIYEKDWLKSEWGYSGLVDLEGILYAKGEGVIADDIEIIGNIFSNPELLEGGE